VRARNIFLDILSAVRDRYVFALVGYVVMPEHIHLLISEPAKGTPSTVLQVLKQRVSRRIRRKPRRRSLAAPLSLRFDRADHSLPQFWQARFYDFDVWSQKEKVEKLQYMHLNPVKRRLVSRPNDWPWSSFSCYSNLKQGLIGINLVH
jgi:REP-associated tyrosine transposase